MLNALAGQIKVMYRLVEKTIEALEHPGVDNDSIVATLKEVVFYDVE